MYPIIEIGLDSTHNKFYCLYSNFEQILNGKELSKYTFIEATKLHEEAVLFQSLSGSIFGTCFDGTDIKIIKDNNDKYFVQFQTIIIISIQDLLAKKYKQGKRESEEHYEYRLVQMFLTDLQHLYENKKHLSSSYHLYTDYNLRKPKESIWPWGYKNELKD